MEREKLLDEKKESGRVGEEGKGKKTEAHKYREDIDGLRGIAVAAVIIFHFSKNSLPGGFAGVDVFFVISGFLITQNILKEMKEGKFSLSSFYSRRVKRIFPAFVVCVFFVLLFGWFLFLPAKIVQTARSAIASLFSSSNFFNCFFVESGYFAEDTAKIPLLHLWSLAVEEQFYFVWPLFMFALWKFEIKENDGKVAGWKSLLTVALVITFSTLFGQIFAVRNQSIAYYMLPTRMGEIAIGSLLAMKKPDLPRVENEVAGLVGLFLIFLSFFFLNETSTFPGFNTLIPCVGTYLLILSGSNSRNTFSSKILSFPPLVYVGLLSYSLYLYHWPVLSFARYLSTPFTPLNTFTLLLYLSSFTLFSFYCVETPLRKLKMSTKWIFASFLLTVILLTIGCHFISIGTFQRAPNQQIVSKSTPPSQNQKGLVSAVENIQTPSDFNISEYHFRYSSCESSGPLRKICLALLPKWGHKVPECSPDGLVKDFETDRCWNGNANSGNANSFLLTGNSHAAHFFPIIERFALEIGLKFFIWSFPGPLFPGIFPTEMCKDKEYRNFFSPLEKTLNNFPVVMFAVKWDQNRESWFAEFENTVSRLVNRNQSVILLGQIPDFEEGYPGLECPRIKSNDVMWSGKCNLNSKLKEQTRILSKNRKLWKLSIKYPRVTYWDPIEYVCPLGVCSTYYRNIKLFVDYNHLSFAGAQLLGKDIMEQIGVPPAIRTHFLKD